MDWPIYDIHAHARYGRPETDDEIVAAGREMGVTRINHLGDVLAFGFHPTPEEISLINDGSRGSLERHPDVFSCFCFANPENPADFSLAEIERAVREDGFRGVKLEASVLASDHRLDPIMEAAERLGVPVLHHAWYQTTESNAVQSTPADIADLASRFPRVQIIMAHLGGARVRGVQDIRPYPNVSIDTSGSQPMAGLVEYAVAVLGPHRVVYGSDVPGRDYSAQIGRIAGAHVSDRDKEKIFHENARRLIGE